VKLNFQQKNFLLVLWIILVVACSSQRSLTKQEVIEDIIHSISSENLKTTVLELQNFNTRYPYEKQLKVADYLYNRIKAYIPDTQFHIYEYWGVYWKNVIATIPGLDYPNKVYIVCAHFDSKSEKRLVYAPGADDNASGCAAVLEVARVLSSYHFKHTIKFIFFSREENGQNGSRAYIRSINPNEEKIIGVINIDMIAFGSDKEDIDLVTRPKHRWIVNYVNQIGKLYNIPTKKVIKKHCF